jgi:hypothetical protein
VAITAARDSATWRFSISHRNFLIRVLRTEI